MSNIISLQNLSKTELLEICNQPENSLETYLKPEDKKEIVIQLCKMSLLRGENIEDYIFELWIEYFQEQRYSKEIILEIIDCGKRMTKYGNNKLAIGDLLTEWEKSSEYADYYEIKRRDRLNKRLREKKEESQKYLTE